MLLPFEASAEFVGATIREEDAVTTEVMVVTPPPTPVVTIAEVVGVKVGVVEVVEEVEVGEGVVRTVVPELELVVDGLVGTFVVEVVEEVEVGGVTGGEVVSEVVVGGGWVVEVVELVVSGGGGGRVLWIR